MQGAFEWEPNKAILFFTPTDIILPSGLNSSSKIVAISGAHNDSVTAIYLLPTKQDKYIDVHM